MQLANTAIVIAHYHPSGRFARYLIELIVELRRRGATIVVVSTGLSDVAAQEIATLAHVIRRENVGYDFWSYRVGIDYLGDLSRFERLIIFNSSFLVLEPRSLCSKFLDTAGDADLLGLTYSREHKPHIQSYWICFNSHRILRSEAFAQWWREMTPISDRQLVIERYELGLTEFFISRGFVGGVTFNPTRHDKFIAFCRAAERGILRPPVGSQGPFSIDPDLSESLNPTHFFFDALIRELGIVKLELLRNNSNGLNLYHLLKAINSTERHQHLLEDSLL